jgi:hypothetical protein
VVPLPSPWLVLSGLPKYFGHAVVPSCARLLTGSITASKRMNQNISVLGDGLILGER